MEGLIAPYCNNGATDTVDLGSAMPDILRACVEAKKEDPYTLLSNMHKHEPALAVSYGALLALFPEELFGLPNTNRLQLLMTGLKNGAISSGYLDGLAEWRDDEEKSIILEVVGELEQQAQIPNQLMLQECLSMAACLYSSERCISLILDNNVNLIVQLASTPLLNIDTHLVDSNGASFAHYQTTFELLTSHLYALVMRSLKVDRPRTVCQLLQVANGNKDRLKMQFEADKVCSDACAMVMFAVHLRLAEPFAVANHRRDKEPLIDREYYRRFEGRLNIDGFNTVIDVPEEEEQEAQEDKKGPNFISDAFYLTLHWMKASVIRMIEDYYETGRVLAEIEAALPMVNPLVKGKLAGDKARLQATKVFLESFLMNDHLFQETLCFAHLLMYHLLAVQKSSKRQYAMLPEFYIDCVNELFVFMSRSVPNRWLQFTEPYDLYMEYMTCMLADPGMCRNIYQRAKQVEVLHGWLAPGLDGRSRPLQRLFSLTFTTTNNESKGLPATLTPLLMRMYVDVEQTGASRQFYEKFNIRFHLTSIFNELYESVLEYQHAVQAAAGRPESFLRFQNLLLNDCTFLLDESLGKLQELHNMQYNLNDVPANLQEQQQTERQLTSYMQLANADIKFLTSLTHDCPAPFARPEIGGRLAAMLLVNQSQLVGDRCRNLRVNQPERYHFDPRRLLSALCRIFVNMSGERSFCEAVRSDRRSFNPQLLESIVKVLERTKAVSQFELEVFTEAANRIASHSGGGGGCDGDDYDLEDADIPEAYLDPLMFTVMRDPVRLRTSNVIVDRATIRAHLLNDPHDPFNRQPMEEAVDVEEAGELRAEIEAFMASRRR